MKQTSKGYIILLFILSLVFDVNSQDLEPHYLSPIPTGGNFAVASYGYSGGNILLDNSLPIEDLNANLNSVVLAYARSFKFLGHLAKFDVVVPYSFADFTGVVNGTDSSTSRAGFGDPMARLSVILIGSKAMDLAEFVKASQKIFNLGVYVRLRPPLGQYDPTKFINLGSNRWATRVGLGASYNINKKLIVELHYNTWFFSDNREFFNGNTIEQKPLLSTQLHLTYVFKPGIWLALSGGRSFLGETVVNGEEKEDLKNSYRVGSVLAYRIDKNNAIKVAITSGLSTRYGADFTSIIIAYQFIWFDKK